MDFGYTVPSRGSLAKPDVVSRLAKYGESVGFSILGASDHVVFPTNIDSTYPYSESGHISRLGNGEILDPLILLTYIAGQTQSVKLLTSVMVVPHRPAVLAAKMISTISFLSNSRFILGVGSGWLREEFEALQLPPFEERGKVTDEYIEAFRELWAAEVANFQGKYVQFSDVLFSPKPNDTESRNMPPIWVGGESPAALRRVALHGDGWYPIGANPRFPMDSIERLGKAKETIMQNAERVNRDPSEIEYAYHVNWYSTEPIYQSGTRKIFTGDTGLIAQDLERMNSIGFQKIIIDLSAQSETEMTERIGKFSEDFKPFFALNY